MKDNLVKAKAKQKVYYNKKHRESDFKVGDLVWRDMHVLSYATKQFAAKLAPRRDGPFQTSKMISENVVILFDGKTK